MSLAPKRIGLLGAFGCGNAGNDGTLEAMLSFLREVRPDAGLMCFCQPSHGADDLVSQRFNVSATPLAVPRPGSAVLRFFDDLSLGGVRQLVSLLRALAFASRLDVLILPGTGTLDDFQKRSLGMPAAVFGWCLAARLCGTRIAFVSVGAGPVHHRLSRWLMKRAAAMADYRSYRDAGSREFMAGIGLPARDDPIYPDLAFSLRPPASPARPNAEQPVVGVGVMAYRGWRRDDGRGNAIYGSYVDTMASFVLWLLGRGHPVRFLMGEPKDQRAVDDIMTKVTGARSDRAQDDLTVEPMPSLHELMRQIALTDVVVATRFHNVVCALKMGKPTVSIGYGAKNQAVMADMGLDRFCQHIEHLDLDLLIDQFTQVVAHRQILSRRILRANRALERRLQHQNAVLTSRIL